MIKQLCCLFTYFAVKIYMFGMITKLSCMTWIDKYKVENLTLKRDTSYSEMIVLFQSFAICFQFAHKDGVCWEVVLRNLQLNARRSLFGLNLIIYRILSIDIFSFLHVDLNDSFKKKWQLLTIEK